MMTSRADALATLRTQITTEMAAHEDASEMAGAIGDTRLILRMIEEVELADRAGRSTEADDKWAVLLAMISEWAATGARMVAVMNRQADALKTVHTVWRERYPQAKTLGEVAELGGPEVRRLIESAFAA